MVIAPGGILATEIPNYKARLATLLVDFRPSDEARRSRYCILVGWGVPNKATNSLLSMGKSGVCRRREIVNLSGFP